MATQTLVTAEQFDHLPNEEGRKYELWDGELIELPSASPRHNETVSVLLIDLGGFLQSSDTGRAIPDTEFALGANLRYRPDIAVLLSSKWAQVDRDRVPVRVVPDIAIEVISPSELAYHVERKIGAYLKAGVNEVWVLYQAGRIYIHTIAAVRRFLETEVLTSPLLAGWSIPVAKLFPGPPPPEEEEGE